MIRIICRLTQALDLCDGSRETVQEVFARVTACFWPRLPGLTKLMARYTRSNDWQKAIAIFESLPMLRLQPDTTITNAAIAACDRGGAWHKAFQIFSDMSLQGLVQDTITFSSTISALSKSKQAQRIVWVRCHLIATYVMQ